MVGEQRTLAQLLAARSPGFDLVRLILAELVLISHTWPLGGFGNEPSSPFGNLTLGGFAVGGFFALSGLMVGQSAMRRSASSYASARARRVLPGLWANLLICAVIVAPVGWAHFHRSLGGFFTLRPNGPIAWLVRAATLPVAFVHGISDVFAADTPYGRATAGGSWINGSLWTLPYEVRCYLVLAAVALVARRLHRPRVVVTAAWTIVAVLAVLYWKRVQLTTSVVGPYADRQLVLFLFVFLTGTLAAVWADRLMVVGWAAIAALLVAVAAGRRAGFIAEHLTIAPLALLLPVVAVGLAPAGRWLRGVDLSYGLYLYAWPVQQLVAMYSWAGSPLTFIVISTLLTTGCAALSWVVVERRFLRRAPVATRP